ncbi:spore coat protein [Paenibacillus macerans]|uniref:spore coat protein n=1 Tax=Paenibacillus macerans TaxID=44252 RepID=UPI003D31C86C
MLNWATHEFLETTELLRKLTADIELHAFFAEMTSDQEIKNMLQRHIQIMDSTYHQAMNLLQHKGVRIDNSIRFQHNVEHKPHLGFQNPQTIPVPNMNGNRLSDITICTVILNSHKAGSAIGMLWASECVDPDVRSFHIMCANNCQQMAYDVFQLMNQRGYYEVPTMPQSDVRKMSSTFQYMSNPNIMNGNTTTNQFS